MIITLFRYRLILYITIHLCHSFYFMTLLKKRILQLGKILRIEIKFDHWNSVVLWGKWGEC